jgi:sugar/nucleoside kinase (ribokinase family)
VKRGSAAAICRSGQQQYSLMPPSVKPVDDVGAGDSFDAGFIHKFTAGARLEDCLAFANLAGAYSTTKEGGTEAFRDRIALTSVVRQHGETVGPGHAPAEGITIRLLHNSLP